MNYVSVCKNVIAANNKADWVDPAPAIRVSNSRAGKVVARAHTLLIKDQFGNEVARVISSQDGRPVISCGAKVAILTMYDTEVLE